MSISKPQTPKQPSGTDGAGNIKASSKSPLDRVSAALAKLMAYPIATFANSIAWAGMTIVDRYFAHIEFIEVDEESTESDVMRWGKAS